MLDLCPYGGTDLLSMFPLFLKRNADFLAHRFDLVFRRFLRLCSCFPAWRRQANVTPISKVPCSSSVANYRPISITPVLPKVFERLHESVCLVRFMELCGVLPTTKDAYRKGLGTFDAPLCVFHALQRALESWQVARMLSISCVLWVLEVLCSTF